jgi:2-oxoglutarate dehydrogenase E2 component (dihydrolipoamide succinyltransferase)
LQAKSNADMSVIDVVMPSLGESIVEVSVAQLLKPEGTIVKRDDLIAVFESDKSDVELPVDVAGKLIWKIKEGDMIAIGSVVAQIDTSAAVAAAPAAPVAAAPVAAPAQAAPAASADHYAKGTPSPAAAKTMAEAGLTSTQVIGTGPDGRITKDDAVKAAANPAALVSVPTAPTAPISAPAAPVTASATSAPVPMGLRAERRQRMSQMRKTIARRLVSAKNTTAMLTTFNEVDMQPIMKLREQYQDRFVKKHGVKLGFMSLFVKACAQALMEMPDVNARIEGEEIVYHDYVDCGVAVSTPKGLVVPPLRDAQNMSLAQIELAIKGLAEKARDGKLSIPEMTGGTFTITNGGTFGSLMSTPILNEPQSAILGMHAIKERPVVVNGEIVIRPMMYLALSYDHRVIDGSTSVTFLVKVKGYLEDPASMLLGL